MRKQMAALLVVSVLLTGCTGSFNLTRKVYNFHRSQDDKWADELCFLLVTMVPVYGLATFADAIVFNSIEFWTGDNPVEMTNAAPTSKVVKSGKEELKMTHDPANNQVSLTSEKWQRNKPTLVLEKNDQMVVAKNTKGQVLYSSIKSEAGDIAVYNADGQLVKNYSAGQVESLKEDYLR